MPRPRTLLLIVAAAATLGVTTRLIAADQPSGAKAAVRQITGQLIDTRCYVKNGSIGDDHQQCAMDCLKEGEPAGILVPETKEIYYILAPGAGFAEWANKTVRLTGKIDDKLRAVVPTKIEIKKGDAWVEGKLPKTMM